MNIREAKNSDAESLLNLFSRLDDETKFMLFEPGERKTTKSEQLGIIEAFSKSKNRFMFVAEVEDIVGFCVLAGNLQQRNWHVASLVIGVEKSMWNRGVGSMLMEAAISKAEEVGLKRIELTVRTDNDPAIALYKKYGFVNEGERIGSLNVDGRLVNEFYMAKV